MDYCNDSGDKKIKKPSIASRFLIFKFVSLWEYLSAVCSGKFAKFLKLPKMFLVPPVFMRITQKQIEIFLLSR